MSELFSSNAAFYQIGAPLHRSLFVFTCDHASPEIPPEFQRSQYPCPFEEQLLSSHHAFDIGAASLTHHLQSLTQSSGVLAKFSRLVCDPNRFPNDPDWIRLDVEGHSLSFNVNISQEERLHRKHLLHDPYHLAIDTLLALRRENDLPSLVVALHSFTPIFKGEKREMEIGIMFHHNESQALTFAANLRMEGFKVALNAPYSGRGGKDYKAPYHDHYYQDPLLQVEIRQDLLKTPQLQKNVAQRITQALRALK